MTSVQQALEECEDMTLSKASQRCDRVKLTGELRGKCTRAQVTALQSLKESVLGDKDLFEKGPASIKWLKTLVKAQIHGRAVLSSSVVEAATFDLDRCLVRKFPIGQKFDERESIKNDTMLNTDPQVAIRTTRQGVSFIEVTFPDQTTDIPLKCKDGTISFLKPVPKHIELEVERLFKLMAQEHKKYVHGNCVRGGTPDFGPKKTEWIASFGR